MAGGTLKCSEPAVASFLKWPGGKRWLASDLTEIIRSELKRKYFEPFLGGGSVYFRLKPKKAYLSDINRDLITCLEMVREKPGEVIRAVWRYSNTRRCYYHVRSLKPRTAIGAAARFIYLNRTCWGGITRFNRKGDFNVPFGNSGRRICSAIQLKSCAEVLKNVSLKSLDFEEAMAMASEGDVIYADPPYTIREKNNGFLRFNDKLFNWEDQKRLAEASQKAKRRGVFVAVSQIWHKDLIKLFAGWWALKMSRTSLVSRDPSKRLIISELLLFSRRPSSCPLAVKKALQLIES